MDEWPEPMGRAAFHGFAGRLVDVIDTHTEADRAAVLVQFLVAFGSACGREAHAQVGATLHAGNEFASLVGQTARARKGESWAPVRHLFKLADPDWATRIVNGLSSGEGITNYLRDPAPGDPETDRRLLAMEPEFARVLRTSERQGNTISAVLREAWDGGTLSVLTRNDPLRATDTHVSLITHITCEELHRELSDTAQANGFGNRFLWIAVRRSKRLPRPPIFAGAGVNLLAVELADRIRVARQRRLMDMTKDAEALWDASYEDLTAERRGLTGALLARAEAHALRLSLLYALVDGASAIGVEHLLAAFEVWGYVERSVEHLFGQRLGDSLADRIVEALTQRVELTESGIRDLFARNQPAARIGAALEDLRLAGRVTNELRETGGRPASVWRLSA
jgi:hypothetical protein